MARDFASQVKAFADKAQRRQLAIFRESAQRVAQRANVPQAQGGKLPVNTGFMRASQAGSVSGMPAGPGKGEPGRLYNAPLGQPVELAILQARIGGTVHIGWTANYARFMEARYGFMRSEAQNWGSIVNDVTTEVKRRYP